MIDTDADTRVNLSDKDSKEYKIWMKTNGLCHYCGLPIDPWKDGQVRSFTVEHLRPRCYGGTDDLDNLVATHFVCNKMRGNVHPDDIPPTFGEMCREAVVANRFLGALKNVHLPAKRGRNSMPPGWGLLQKKLARQEADALYGV